MRTPDPSFQRPYAPRGTEWSTSAAIPIVHCLKIARRQEEQVIEGEGHYRVLLRSYGSFCPWLHSRPIEVQRNPTVGRTAPGSHASLTIPRIPMSVPHVSRIRTTMEPSAMLSSNDEYRYDKHLISSCQNSVNAQWYKATRGAARRYSHRVQSSNSVRSESGAYSYYQWKLVTSSAGKSENANTNSGK